MICPYFCTAEVYGRVKAEQQRLYREQLERKLESQLADAEVAGDLATLRAVYGTALDYDLLDIASRAVGAATNSSP